MLSERRVALSELVAVMVVSSDAVRGGLEPGKKACMGRCSESDWTVGPPEHQSSFPDRPRLRAQVLRVVIGSPGVDGDQEDARRKIGRA